MESKYSVIHYGPEVVESIRKQYNLDTEEKRESAFKIIEQWLEKQHHFVKKDYSRDYLEKCLVMTKGSIERAKKQIDKICTLRTLMPKYFEVTNLRESALAATVNKCYFGYSSKLTENNHRVALIRLRSDTDIKTFDYSDMFKFFSIMSEFLKNYDYCDGYIFVCDYLEEQTIQVLGQINFVELQQILPVYTTAQGFKVKNLIFLTSSKLIEGFVKMLKPIISDKIGARVHVASNKEALKKLLPDYVLPEEYGGTEKPLSQLHDEMFETLSSESVQKLLVEMNAAKTDESKRQKGSFTEKYLGIPGSFRSMSLD